MGCAAGRGRDVLHFLSLAETGIMERTMEIAYGLPFCCEIVSFANDTMYLNNIFLYSFTSLHSPFKKVFKHFNL